MLLGETLRVALDALRTNKLRSLLTMLGIVIGVGAVIAMLALGNGAQKAVSDRIAALGTTLLTVNSQRVTVGGIQSTDTKIMRIDDVKMLQDRGTLFVSVTPQQDRSLLVSWRDRNTSSQIVGCYANYIVVRSYHIGVGRMFTEREDDARRRVAVLGSDVVEQLHFPSAEAALGQHVRIRGVSFEVIGVLATMGQQSPGFNPDNQVLMPFQTGRFDVFGTPRVGDIHILAPSEDLIPETMIEIQKIMRRSHRIRAGQPDDFVIRDQADFLNTLNETTAVFTYLLAGIATVSLLVGGIGIMNIMLVSVTERTKEIGTRKALGATKRNILLQFLIEAVVLCLLGGLLGVIIGVGSAIVLHTMFYWNTIIVPSSIVLAFLFSGSVGIIFGVWPARRAAGLDPIEALRYE